MTSQELKILIDETLERLQNRTTSDTELSAQLEKTAAAIGNLTSVKGLEYAGKGDRLANFIRGAAMTGCTPLQVSLIYLAKHFDSVCTYIRRDAANETQHLSEPIEGRFDDIIVYCLLMKAIIAESAK